MRSWSLLFALLALLTSGLMLLGCPADSDDDDDSVAGDDDDTGPQPDDDDDPPDDDDDDDDDDATTVAEICTIVFECFANDWGWTDLQECEELWLTGCADENAYLVCTNGCITGDCGDFALEDGSGGCEFDCWEAYCM
jgi:hypothetical protein